MYYLSNWVDSLCIIDDNIMEESKITHEDLKALILNDFIKSASGSDFVVFDGTEFKNMSLQALANELDGFMLGVSLGNGSYDISINRGICQATYSISLDELSWRRSRYSNKKYGVYMLRHNDDYKFWYDGVSYDVYGVHLVMGMFLFQGVLAVRVLLESLRAKIYVLDEYLNDSHVSISRCSLSEFRRSILF